jgi:DNA-binding NtrC family response regulator
MILLVTNDQAFVGNVTRRLGELGKRAVGISEIKELWIRVFQAPPDIIILDGGCPQFDAIEILKELHDRKYEGKTIVLGGRPEAPLLPEASRLGAIQVAGRPLAVNRVLGAIRIAQEHLETDRYASSLSGRVH